MNNNLCYEQEFVLDISPKLHSCMNNISFDAQSSHYCYSTYDKERIPKKMVLMHLMQFTNQVNMRNYSL